MLDIGGRRLGISICEDVWNDRDFWKRRRYHHDPIEELVARRRAGDRQPVGVAVLRRQARAAAKRCSAAWRASTGVPVVYVNQFGGNDDLVFDGRSCAFNAAGAADRARPRRSTPTSSICDLDSARADRAAAPTSTPNRKSGARSCSARATTRASAASRSVVLGLSGGIDSALTAAIAAEALGADHVLGVLMPSPYSSRGSVDDALAARGATSASRR